MFDFIAAILPTSEEGGFAWGGWTIDQMCPSDLWMEPRIKALREKIRRKLKKIRQKEEPK